MSLTVFTSNRMEVLVECLAGVVREPAGTPFEPETIVVQSKGMQRWLAMELAKRLGVWANCDYPFPNAVVWRLFRAVVPGIPSSQDKSPFTPEVMAWRLMELLPALTGRPGFDMLRGYLADDGDGLKLLQLAGRIADTFDQYALYRPELLLAWERGEGRDWQPLLWREFVAGQEGKHRAALLDEFRAVTAAGRVDMSLLPRRISLIGIPSLPPFHLEVLARIASCIEVRLFLLNPCREYWGKIVSEREMARLGKQGGERADIQDYYESGNPLLASLGRIGRDFFDLLLSGSDNVDVIERFIEIDDDSLLLAVQADILNLRDRGGEGGKMPISTVDGSLRVHSCHSPLREVEVLYDTLLDLFAGDPAMAPRDILVMTPDIETYAPYVSAVFGAPDAPELKIPYSIADRSLRREGEIAEAFLAILNLCGSRITVVRVLDILEASPVARRFGLHDTDLEKIRMWVRDTGIRWGIDGNERREQGVPSFSENSWQAGIDRLILGHALAGGEGRLFNGIPPYDGVEGNALLLGRFLEFAERLFAKVRALRNSRAPAEWRVSLLETLDDFIQADGDGEREFMAVAQVVARLAECSEQAGFDGKITIEVVRAWLEERLTREQRGFGFLTGGVTFCAMLPMRSIPFRVVALLGMNDGAFPRRNPPPDFDLIARNPRPGDRALRDEDRYLFLEALLSARERLHISYVGQSVRDNSELPPSVLVSELLDYVARGFTADDGDPLAVVLVKHRLQPFSPDYFREGGGVSLFSYSRENCRGVTAKLVAGAETAPFIVAPLPTPEEEGRDVTLADLADFLGNPARHFLRRRLGIHLERSEDSLEESEPFLLGPLEKYQIDQEIVAALLEGRDLDAQQALLRGQGVLPPGRLGIETYREHVEAVRPFAAVVQVAGAGEPLPPLELDLELAGFRLTGRLPRIRPSGLFYYRYAKVKAKDRLRGWVEHLALGCAASEGYPLTTTIFGSDLIVNFAPAEGSRDILAHLLSLYRRGMSAPLRFFPETSLEYMKKASDPKKADRALADARKKWRGSEDYPGESGDPDNRRCFGDEEPLDGEFENIARMVYGPLLSCQSEKKL